MRTLSCALLLAAVAAAQSFDSLLPESTVAYVSIENAKRTKERWDASRLAALWKDEAMQAFLEKPRAAWAKAMEKMLDEDGGTVDEVLDLLAGQFAVGATWPEGAEEPAVLVLADIGENREKLLELLARIEKREADEGQKRDEEEFRGVKIVQYKYGDEPDSAWFLDGTMFALTDTAEALKDVLARKDRTEGTLASRELYKRTRARLGARSSDVFVYVDGPNLLTGLQGAGLVDEQKMHVLAALGITAIEGLAVEFAIEPKALALRMFLPVKGAKTGFMKLLDAKNSALVPPRYVPAEALTAGAWTIDTAALWEEARRTMDRIEEGMSEQMDAQLAMFKEQMGVDIQGDIIASLGNGIAYHTLAPAPAKEGDAAANPMGMSRFVLSLEIKDRERFEGALEKLLTAYGLAPVTQEYLGVKVRKVPTMFGFIPTFAVLPDRVLFSMETDLVKDVITRYGKEAPGFVDREDMAKALATLPAGRFVVSAEDLPSSLAAASSALASMMSLVAMEEPEFAEAVDLTLFPPKEVLRKYVGMTVGCLVNEEDGLSYVTLFHLAGE
jgi:hypothetical protein